MSKYLPDFDKMRPDGSSGSMGLSQEEYLMINDDQREFLMRMNRLSDEVCEAYIKAIESCELEDREESLAALSVQASCLYGLVIAKAAESGAEVPAEQMIRLGSAAIQAAQRKCAP